MRVLRKWHACQLWPVLCLNDRGMTPIKRKRCFNPSHKCFAICMVALVAWVCTCVSFIPQKRGPANSQQQKKEKAWNQGQGLYSRELHQTLVMRLSDHFLRQMFLSVTTQTPGAAKILRIWQESPRQHEGWCWLVWSIIPFFRTLPVFVLLNSQLAGFGVYPGATQKFTKTSHRRDVCRTKFTHPSQRPSYAFVGWTTIDIFDESFFFSSARFLLRGTVKPNRRFT